jgi:phenylalanyl-tRNA synthetase alpha subunit
VQVLPVVRVQFTGKKSQLAEQSKALGKMDPEERKVQGAAIHAVRELTNSFLYLSNRMNCTNPLTTARQCNINRFTC